MRRFLQYFACALALLAPAGSASGASDNDYAPENLEKTDKTFDKVCYIHRLCPLADDRRDIIKRSLKGDEAAQYLLGLWLINGNGLPREEKSGLAWVVVAAEHGSPGAVMYLARRIRNGAAIELDETKAAAALKPLVDVGNTEAMRALAPMYFGGRGVKQDPAQGLALLKTAAQKGSTEAERDLSRIYEDNVPGVPVDRAEAMKWLIASAQHGNIDAMTSVGYRAINVGDRDVVTGYCWLVRAALLDQSQAQEKLALTLSRGDKDGHGNTLPIDLVQADYWLRVMVRNPAYENPQIRSAIEPKMTTDQLNQAKALFDAFKVRTFDEIKAMTIALPAMPNKPPRNCPAMQ